MGLLEELLKRSKDHSQSVIIVLIGLILIGSIGGGIWIHNLESALENQDKLGRERLEARNDDYDARLSNLKLRITFFEQRLEDFKYAINLQQKSMSDAIAALKALSQEKTIGPEKRAELTQLAHDLELRQLLSGDAMTSAGTALENAKSPSGLPESGPFPPSGSPFGTIRFVVDLYCAGIATDSNL